MNGYSNGCFSWHTTYFPHSNSYILILPGWQLSLSLKRKKTAIVLSWFINRITEYYNKKITLRCKIQIDELNKLVQRLGLGFKKIFLLISLLLLFCFFFATTVATSELFYIKFHSLFVDVQLLSTSGLHCFILLFGHHGFHSRDNAFTTTW